MIVRFDLPTAGEPASAAQLLVLDQLTESFDEVGQDFMRLPRAIPGR